MTTEQVVTNKPTHSQESFPEFLIPVVIFGIPLVIGSACGIAANWSMTHPEQTVELLSDIIPNLLFP